MYRIAQNIIEIVQTHNIQEISSKKYKSKLNRIPPLYNMAERLEQIQDSLYVL